MDYSTKSGMEWRAEKEFKEKAERLDLGELAKQFALIDKERQQLEIGLKSARWRLGILSSLAESKGVCLSTSEKNSV